MELGVLLVPINNVTEIIDLHNRYSKELNPDYIWIPDRLLDYDISTIRKHIGDISTGTAIEFLDPFTIIAILSQINRNAKFGVAVTDFVRRSAPDLARTANTLSQCLKHPVNMGFGAGESINLISLGYRRSSKPVSFFEEQLKIFDSINGHGISAVYQGQHISMENKPSHAEIWVGGQRERMLEITGRYADGWLPAWKVDSAEYKRNVDHILRTSSALNRPQPKLGMLAEVIVGDSKEQIFEHFQRTPLDKHIALSASASVWEKWGLNHPAGSHTKGLYDVLLNEIEPEVLYESIMSVPPAFIADIAFVGAAQDILTELWEYREAGMEHLSFVVPDRSSTNNSHCVGDHYPKFVEIFNEVRDW